ncbi:MAG: SDR family oxidoreductase [Dehalococcoidia bacterium]
MDMAEINLGGKVAIITGSSQGIGNTLARGFARAGAFVFMVARNGSRLESEVRAIESDGGKALALPADVTRAEEVEKMASQALANSGRIDILVNCAGGSGEFRFRPLLDLEENAWDQVIELNLKSVYLCCRAVGQHMAEKMGGAIINFSSGASIQPVPGMTHYCSAKAAVNQFTRVLAVEWGKYNIRVNAISPGLTDTEGERRWMPPEMMEKYSKAVPLGRIGKPEDILGTALFLASDMSSYLSGAIISVSGGPQ